MRIEPWLSMRQGNTLTIVPMVLTDVRRLEKTLNLQGIKPSFSIQQADTLTGAPMEFTVVFYFLFLLISYVNS